jgi:hypothetical protein
MGGWCGNDQAVEGLEFAMDAANDVAKDAAYAVAKDASTLPPCAAVEAQWMLS